MKNIFKFSVLIINFVIITAQANAAEFIVGQQDKKFSHKMMTINVGDIVHFKNNDPFSHNVYSLSDAKSFDLGSYPHGNQRSVTFDKPGKIEIGCAIHLNMAMEIEVK